jgi:DNA-binding CsgD family transcriptional regulator
MRYLNSQAEKLLGDDFSLVRGRPAARLPADDKRLQRLVSNALHIERDASGSRPSIVQSLPIVINRNYAPWLLVEAMPLSALGDDQFNGGRAVLFLTDLTCPRWPDAAVLSVAFGLTAAEARLAVLLAVGGGINEAAAALGVRRETVRSQLRTIFAKTNTGRQAELAELLARVRPIGRAMTLDNRI